MAEDARERDLPELNPKWLRCMDENMNSCICSIDNALNSAYVRKTIIIAPWADFNTEIRKSCLFFVQNASSTWEISSAIMFGTTSGSVLNTCDYSGFFKSDKHIDVYRTSTSGDIMIKNNTSYERTVYYFALELFN